MFEKVINKFNNFKEEARERMEERARIARERAEEEARMERERVRAEKEALLTLSEKELMVEAIMELKRCNLRLNIVEEILDNMQYRIGSIDINVSSMDSSLNELKYK